MTIDHHFNHHDWEEHEYYPDLVPLFLRVRGCAARFGPMMEIPGFGPRYFNGFQGKVYRQDYFSPDGVGYEVGQLIFSLTS